MKQSFKKQIGPLSHRLNDVGIEEHQDHIYYNIDIKTKNNEGEPARFNIDLSEDIVGKGSDYHAAVARFRCPVSDIPFVLFRVLEGPTQSDPNLGRYLFGLNYAGTFYNNYVEYVNIQGYSSPPVAPSENSGLQYFQDGYDYYYIYTIEFFLELWNNTLIKCVDDLLTAVPALAPLDYPYFKSAPGGDIEFVYPRKFITEGIDLYYNSWLNPYIFGLTTEYVIGNPDFEHKIRLVELPEYENGYVPFGGTAVVPPDWLVARPSFPQVPYWGELQSIVFRTTKLPIRSEMTNSDLGYALVSEPILTDFVVSEWDGNRSDIVFVPNGPYRLLDVVSDQPIRSIDVQIFWKDILGRITPLFIYPGTDVGIKLAFLKEGQIN